MQKGVSAKKIAMIAVMTALMCVSAQIAMPLPFSPVPISLAMLPVFLAGAVLGFSGVVAVAVYLVMGALGLPVFAGFGAGIAHLAGPTGGYLIGYLIAAAATYLIVKVLGKSYLKCAFAMTSGLILCYAAGTIYFSLFTGISFSAAVSLCVLPFLAGDALKIILADYIVMRLKRLKTLDFNLYER